MRLDEGTISPLADGVDRALSPLPGGNDRALSPVVGKTLELGVMVLLVALLTATLYGGVVPEYRSTAAGELGDRTLARAAGDVERAVPPNETGGLPHEEAAVAVRAPVHLPGTIREIGRASCRERV